MGFVIDLEHFKYKYIDCANLVLISLIFMNCCPHFKAEAETKCEFVGEASHARDVVMPSSESLSRK